MPRICFQILTFLLFITFPFHGNSQSQTPNPTSSDELTILLKIKEFWGEPSFTSHWNQSSDHCSWPEITCADNSVTGISAYNYGISGTIPPFTCDLKNLMVLNMSNNLIHGLFPTVLYNCSKLVNLDLSQNLFIGTIPDDIDRLSPDLEILNLEDNNFTGDVPPAIGKLTGLKSLHLTGNLFNGSFPGEIGNLLNLEELAMSNNGFAPQVLPSSFSGLKKLKNLWMFGANLIGGIPQDIGNLTALEFLDLSKNMLTGNIPEGVFQLKNLSILYLYNNRLFGPIPQSVAALNLEVIDLSNNSLTGKIPDDFGKLTKLTRLALFFNQFSGEVPASIGMLPALNDFSLFTNQFSGQLPPELGKHSMLRIFQVSDNHFVGSLPEGLCTSGILMGVAAFNNNLTGTLPQSLGSCNSLGVVLINGNRLSGQIPDGLWTATNLSKLIISDNSFTGQLPDRVAANVSIIDISNNQFDGRIPDGVSSWTSLREFKASNNHLSGDIPEGLTSLAALNLLLLDGNQLSGSLPSSIISWKKLTVLNFSRNQLSGLIPDALGLLPALTDLDLSQNEFSGQIPTQLGQRPLIVLNLSSNHLSGEIPDALQNAVYDRSFLENPGLCARNPSVNVPSCVSKGPGRLSSKFVAAVCSVIAVALLVALVYGFFLIRDHKKKNQASYSSWKLTSFHKFDFPASTILSNLTENNMIGSGGSGQVYRVPTHRAGEYIAVKKICNTNRLDEKLEKEFYAEAEILGTIRHSNIVKLMCCISTENSKLLVYEYMENRSLDRWLHSKNRPHMNTSSVLPTRLDWSRRLQIAIAAAQGLSYMHHDCSPPIIHRDLKSSNILLDSEFNAKIADFGLARTLVKDGEPNTMSIVAGSFGYIAPEYAQTRRVNEKIDVYSFGVILLELVTGREGNQGDETSSLSEWAWRHCKEERQIIDALDEDIKDSCYLDDIIAVFKLGIFCTNPVPSSRPTMREVLQVLLRCVDLMSPGEKNSRSEYDVAPLLENSRRENSSTGEDSSLESIV